MPSIPTGLSATTVNNNWPQLSFTPGFNGGSAVTQYTVTSTPGNLTGTGTGSPISIPGLTGNTFYTFSIYATNAAGNSAVAGPSNQIFFTPYVVSATAPVISGTVTSGGTLTTTNGTWTGYGTTVTSYAYQWNRGGTPISGATSSTYVLTDAEISFLITCTVTATAASPAASGSANSNSLGPFYTPLLVVNQNADATLAVSWSNFTGGSPTTYQILVDGSLQTTVTAPATSVASLSVTSGANRVLTINAYNGATLMSGITKNFRRFDYTGGSQSWAVPVGAPAYILSDVLGAQGGESGGMGGRTKAYIAASNNETIYLYVGGKGTPDTYAGRTACIGNTYWPGGFNGGGNGGGNYAGCGAGTSLQLLGSGGGGASDIRRNGTALSNRIIVSGGGGGCGPASGFINSGCGGTAADVGQGAGYNTGAGSGGVSGQSGCGGGWPISSAGGAASTSSGGSAGTGDETVGNVGSLGQGANGNFSGEGSNNPGRGSGGGGGYYGGGSGGINSNYGSGGSGGGGSGYLDPTLTSIYSSYGTASSGYNTGHGKILLTW